MLMGGRLLQSTLTGILGAVHSFIPAAFDQLSLEVSPVLGFAASTRLEVKVTNAYVDGSFLVSRDLTPDISQWPCLKKVLESVRDTHLDIQCAVSESHIERCLPGLRWRSMQTNLVIGFLMRQQFLKRRIPE